MSRLEQLEQLAAASPNDPMTHYAVGLEHLNLERWQDAAAAFARALKADPRYAAAYYHKGRAEIRAGQRELALATLDVGMVCAREKGDLKTEREMRELRDTIGLG